MWTVSPHKEDATIKHCREINVVDELSLRQGKSGNKGESHYSPVTIKFKYQQPFPVHNETARAVLLLSKLLKQQSNV